MKKSLLFSVAVCASAVSVCAQSAKWSDQPIRPINPETMCDEMVLAEPDFDEMKTDRNQYVKRKKAKSMGTAWYHRPAGVYYAPYVTKDETPGSYSTFYVPWLHASPFSKVTFVNACSDADSWQWNSHGYSREAKGYVWSTSTEENLERDLIQEIDTVPEITAYYGSTFSSYQLKGAKLNSAKEVATEYIARMLSYPDYEYFYPTQHLWYSPKYFAASVNRDFTKKAGSYYKTGALDAEGGTTGCWYGRNFSGVDGMCMAFEKPTHPYALRKVGMRYQMLKINGPVTFTAKVYKLDSIPAFNEEHSVYVNPGELLASGTVEVDTSNVKDKGIMEFYLQVEEDGLVYDVTPHIDFPILVEVSGYNVPEVESFTMLYSSDTYDEGHGELCYAKRLDDQGNYIYKGMNNFFTSGTLYTGVSVFTNIQRPYMVYNYMSETGEKEFPAEGGSYTAQMYSWSCGEEWAITDEQGNELPEWVHVSYADKYVDSEYDNITDVTFAVDALPEGVAGRKCVVKMMFPGAEQFFVITQGSQAIPGDVNGDGAVNVSDVTALVNHIVGAETYPVEVCDVNADGEVNVSDVTALVNQIVN
ncbi:MAG: dockerin type I repeat-containing protein [Sodaliphilus sp.]